MHTLKKIKFLHSFFLILNVFCISCLSQNTSTRSSCGKIPIQTPFLSSDSTASSPILNHMILCRSQKLYFRTSLGLFQVSSIDYTTKTLTITHSSCSSSSKHFVSPSLLSAGFPTPPRPNSLLLFNCSSKSYPMASFIVNCSHWNSCAAASNSCLLVNDLEKLDKGFHPKDLRCTHYSPVYNASINEVDNMGFELGTRISFDIPDHVPDICNECQKSNGNCGVGLRCICHPKECKDKVISMAGSVKPYGNSVLILSSILIIVYFINLLNN